MGLGQRAVQPECWESTEQPPGPAGRGTSYEQQRGPGAHGARPNLAHLAHAIDADVIPRLVLARRAAGTTRPADESGTALRFETHEVLAFTRLVLERDVGEAMAQIAALRTRGASLESIFLDLLSPTARCLGDMWNDDLCDFTQVTVGLWRLQQIVRDLSPAFCDAVEPQDRARRALLVPTQGEQHTFGLFMVAEFFRRAGWDVQAGPLATVDELVDVVRHDWYAVVGISVSSEVRLEGLAGTIHAVRRASRNRGVAVMVGGPVFLRRPELAALVGADASAADGRHATLQAESLLALAALRA